MSEDSPKGLLFEDIDGVQEEGVFITDDGKAPVVDADAVKDDGGIEDPPDEGDAFALRPQQPDREQEGDDPHGQGAHAGGKTAQGQDQCQVEGRAGQQPGWQCPGVLCGL